MLISVLGLTACTTPDLSDFVAQTDALKPHVDTAAAGVARSCERATDDVPEICIGEQLANRMTETFIVVESYSHALESLAAQGRTGNDGASALQSTLISLLPDEADLSGGIDPALRLLSVGLDQMRINALNTTLAETVKQAQPPQQG